MSAIKMSLGPYYKGDTWKGFSVNAVKINDADPTTQLIKCKMQFRDKYGNFGYEYISETDDCKGSIIIDDAATWSFTVKPGVLPLDKGMWWWDFETIDDEGTILTILAGRLRVIQDITQR